MNSMLDIVVRVHAAQAQAQLRQTQMQVRSLANTAGGAGSILNSGLGVRGINSELGKFGKNLQWTGRQLEYNFTLPLLLAGAASTKWALENEASLTKVRKVYGDLSLSQKTIDQEVNALGTSFRLLSDRFGVHQQEVIDIGAAWAAAGASGVALARATKATLEAMIIGDMDAVQATEALIAVQAAYKLNTLELNDALAQMNIIENQTAISFDGLVDVITRAGGSARSAGIDIRHLAAMASALVPTTGSASQAGNALRTMISRLMSPTKDAADVMKEMGINIYDASWQAKNGVQRVETLAQSFDGLTQSQKAVASSLIASRWQINRFDILMADINSSTGNYAKSLEATDKTIKDASGRVKYLAQYTKELNTYLSSSPQRFKMLTVQIQNAMADAILPLLPAMVAILARVAQLAQAFADLDPRLQQVIIGFLLFIMVVGTITKLVGAVITLFYTLAEAAIWLGGAFMGLMRAMLFIIKLPFAFMWNTLVYALALVGDIIQYTAIAIWKLGGVVVAAVKYIGAAIGSLPFIAKAALIAGLILIVTITVMHFRKQLGGAVDYVIEKFQQLPGAIVNVFKSVISVVKKAALLVYEWLSYLNPFQRHSPSLVEQVNAGVDTILDKYAELNGVKRILMGAISAHRDFLRATQSISNTLSATELAGKRADVVAVAPGAGDEFDRVVASLKTMYAALERVGRSVAKQQVVVTRWEASLDAANDRLDEAEGVLEALEKRANSLKSSLDGAREVLDELARTPIEGMRAMSDLIFENEMAQKALRLELLRIEEAVGPIDKLRDRMSKLQGEIEGVRATQAELRNAGAGSDVLSVYDDQISALEAQQKAIEDQVAPINDIQDQLAELERIGQRLDLENSLKFDPLTRQIDQFVNAVEEIPFGTLMSRITSQKAIVKDLEQAWTLADQAVTRQKASVDQLRASRDAIQAVYDREKKKLDELKDAYQGIEQQIRDMEQAINDFASSAAAALDKARQKKKGGDGPSLFDAAGAGDFEVPGGDAGIGREGGLAEIEQFNKDMELELERAMKELGTIDMFGPIKDAWNSAWKWVKDTVVTPYIQPVWDRVKKWWDSKNLSWDSIWESATTLSTYTDAASAAWDTMWGGIKSGASSTWQAIQDGWDGVLSTIQNSRFGGALSNWITSAKLMIGSFLFTLMQVPEILGNLWENVKRFFSSISGTIASYGDLWDPLVEAVGHIVNVLSFVLKVVAGAVLAIVVTIWTILGPVVNNVIRPIFDAIIGVVKGALEVLRGVIQVVLGIINGDWSLVWEGLKSILAGVWDAIFGVVKGAVGVVIGIVKGLWTGIGNFVRLIWSLLPQGFRDAFDRVKGIVLGAVNFVIGVFKGIWGAWTMIWGYINGAWNSIGRPIFDAIVTIVGVIFTVFSTVFNAVAGVLTWFWESVISPIFGFVAGIITDYIIPTIIWFSAVAKTVFQIIAAVVIIAVNIVILILMLLWGFITKVLVPAFKWLADKVSAAWGWIGDKISAAWERIRPIWQAVKDWIVNTLVPKFQSLWDKVSSVWDNVRDKISTAWDKIKPKLQAIKDFVQEVMDKFQSFKDKVVGVFDGIKDKISTVWDSIKEKMKSGVNTGIDAINALIGGLNKVSDVLPGIDFQVDLIPKLAKGGSVPGRVGATAAKVGPGFVTSRPRAIVGEGSPFHPEFVIPTDPRYRGRALKLLGMLASKLGAGAAGATHRMGVKTNAEGVPMFGIGIPRIPGVSDAIDAVKSGAEWVGGKVREGAAMAAFAPFNVIADNLIKLIPWDYVKDATSGVKNDIYDWVKGVNDGVDLELKNLAANLANMVRANPGVDVAGINPDLLRRYAGYNMEMGSPFTIASGKRTLEQQEALYQAYLNGTGNLAAKPNARAPHVLGEAIDHSPGTNWARKYLDAANKWGLKYPVSVEDWHIERIVRAAQGAMLPPRLDASLASGGSIVSRKPGGALLRVGEGRTDERIQVTPINDKEEAKQVVNHFHGPLVFPNVKNGDDAKDFMDSLEALGD